MPAAVEREVPNNSHFMLSRFRYVAVSFPPRHSVYVIPVAAIASLSLFAYPGYKAGYLSLWSWRILQFGNFSRLRLPSPPSPPPLLFFLPTRKLLWMSSFLIILDNTFQASFSSCILYKCYYEDNTKIFRFWSGIVWIIKKKKEIIIKYISETILILI